MGVEERVRDLVRNTLAELAREGALPPEVNGAGFVVERPKRPEHGDLATNVALSIQKVAKQPPRQIADLLLGRLRQSPLIQAAEIAGPGFLNLRLVSSVYHEVLSEILAAGSGYGRAPAATGERILLEFVSANPTGPLLISHARGAILGDAVGALLEATGHRVVREYYVNDFGNQVRLFGESVRAMLDNRTIPDGGYGGDYVKELAEWVEQNAKEVLSDPEPLALARVCIMRMLDGIPGSKVLPGIRRTLAELGVRHDVWFSEESLHRWGKVSSALAELSRRSFLEERDGALFFKSESEGDDKDRVVRKSDGNFTYFASDIAYHADKMDRCYDRLIDVLGADHHGYEARVRGALKALGHPAEKFEVLLCQLVYLLRDGEPVKLGKRLGNIITVEEILEEIDEAARRKGAGADALRYFYLTRRADTSIDFDIEIAKKSSLDNPVFYLQYGYARACSILKRAEEVFPISRSGLRFEGALAARLDKAEELSMIAYLGRFPGVVAEAAALREPHRIVFYLQELSQLFQSYITRFKDDPVLPQKKHTAVLEWDKTWDWDKTRARLFWIDAIRLVYGTGLELLGITALTRMDRLEEAQATDDERDDREETPR